MNLESVADLWAGVAEGDRGKVNFSPAKEGIRSSKNAPPLFNELINGFMMLGSKGRRLALKKVGSEEGRGELALYELGARQIDAQGWSADQVANNRKTKDPRPLVCAGCCACGYTSKDLDPYTCAGCRATEGRGYFHQKDIANKKQQDKKKMPYVLFCPACKQREERLLALVRSKEAWKCNCRCPVHVAKFQLYPGRCRGCNLGVQHKDIEFLARRASNKSWLQ